MGHRALVAYERSDGEYTVRYSQWGALGYRLLDAITAATPLGRRSRANQNPADDDDVDVQDEGTSDQWRGPTVPPVRREPIGTAPDLPALASSFVDPVVHEAVFVVSRSFCVRAFEPLAFWGSTATETHGGALVALRRDRDSGRDAAELRAWRRGATAVLHDARSQPSGDGAQERRGDPPRDDLGDDAVHDRLLDALDAEVDDRTTYPIPPDD